MGRQITAKKKNLARPTTGVAPDNAGSTGLDAYNPPRKRKPFVAVPKGTVKRKSRNKHLRKKGDGITGDFAYGAKG